MEKPSVLIVDDMSTNIDILANALKHEYRILIATSGHKALEIAQQQRPAIILLDILMPEMDGYEVLHQLKNEQETAIIPVILVTGKSEADDEEQGFLLGAVDYIVKPFRISTVKARVRTHIQLYLQSKKLARFNDELQTQVERALQDHQKMVSERELERQALIQQSKMADLGNMMGAIAHQWGQPLTVIAITAEELLDMYEHDELTAERVREIHDTLTNQVAFMSQTVRDFQDFFKPGTRPVTFDAVRAIGEVLELLRGQMMRAKITVVFQKAENAFTFGFPSEFKQVILNILVNARDACVERQCTAARIHVTLEADAGSYRIRITDTAGGVPEHLLPDKLFELFVTTKGRQGTGIGLSLAKKILEKMHGTITARNNEVGAEFELIIPLLAAVPSE